LILSYLHHSGDIYTCELTSVVTIVVTTSVSDYRPTICVYTLVDPVNMLQVNTLWMLLLELIPGATRPSTDINNTNNINFLYVCTVWHVCVIFS